MCGWLVKAWLWGLIIWTPSPPGMSGQGHGDVDCRLAFFVLLKCHNNAKKYAWVWHKIIFWYWIQIIIYTLTFNRPVHIMCTYLPCKAGGKYTVVVSASQATAGMDGQPIWPCCMTVGHKAWFKKCMLMWVAGTGWPAGIMQSFQIGSLWISWLIQWCINLLGIPNTVKIHNTVVKGAGFTWLPNLGTAPVPAWPAIRKLQVTPYLCGTLISYL